MEVGVIPTLPRNCEQLRKPLFTTVPRVWIKSGWEGAVSRFEAASQETCLWIPSREGPRMSVIR